VEINQKPRRLLAPTASWAKMGGNPGLTYSVTVEFNLHVPPMTSDAVSKRIEVPEPADGSPVGALIYSGYSLFYCQKRSVGAGGMNRLQHHTIDIPNEEWRLAFAGNELFCVAKDRVLVCDGSTAIHMSDIPGRFIAQSTTSEGAWCGLCSTGDSYELVIRRPNTEPVKLPKLTGKPIALLLYCAKVTVVTDSGEAYSLFDDQFQLFVQGAPDEGLVVATSAVAGNLLLLRQTPTGYAINEFNSSGRRSGRGTIVTDEVLPRFVVCGSHVYLAESRKGNVIPIELEPLRVGASRPVAGVGRIRDMVGIDDGSQGYLVLAADADAGSSRIIALNPISFASYHLGSFMQGSEVKLIIADGRVVTSISSTNQAATNANAIISYDPFTVAP